MDELTAAVREMNLHAIEDKAGKIDLTVVRLGQEPYPSWKKHITNVLKAKGLYTTVESDRDRDPLRQSQAQALITSSLDQTNRMSVIDCETAHAMWTRLESLNEVKTTFETQNLFIKLNNYKIRSVHDVSESLAEIRYIVAKLKTLGEEVSDNNLMSVILRALPNAMNHIRVSWKTVSDRTLSNLLSYIMSEVIDLTQQLSLIHI